MIQPISDTLVTAVLFLVGFVVTAVSAVILALRTKGDRAITWSGFGVCFRVTPCVDCRLRRKTDVATTPTTEESGGKNDMD